LCSFPEKSNPDVTAVCIKPDAGHTKNHDWLAVSSIFNLISGQYRSRMPTMVFDLRGTEMVTTADDNIDYRLLNRLSNLVICSSCLQRGNVTPVAQVISGRHSLTNKCPDCRDQIVDGENYRPAMGKVLTLQK
jgi:hypothetical protein